jgi:hypothetical protein
MFKKTAIELFHPEVLFVLLIVFAISTYSYVLFLASVIFVAIVYFLKLAINFADSRTSS